MRRNKKVASDQTQVAAKLITAAGIASMLIFSFCGCGIKGPPVPPRPPSVPAVAKLDYQVENQTLTLTWSLSGPLSGKQAKRATFGIYRSRSAVTEPACDDCPLVFENVNTVPYVHTDANRFATSLTLDSGYRYRFKVRLETDGAAGRDSNLVQFDLWP